MARTKTAKISCSTADEAANIQRALENVEVRAFLGIVGALLPLSPCGRTRVLEFVSDTEDENAGRLRIETTGDHHHVEARRAVTS